MKKLLDNESFFALSLVTSQIFRSSIDGSVSETYFENLILHVLQYFKGIDNYLTFNMSKQYAEEFCSSINKIYFYYGNAYKIFNNIKNNKVDKFIKEVHKIKDCHKNLLLSDPNKKHPGMNDYYY